MIRTRERAARHFHQPATRRVAVVNSLIRRTVTMAGRAEVGRYPALQAVAIVKDRGALTALAPSVGSGGLCRRLLGPAKSLELQWLILAPACQGGGCALQSRAALAAA